MLCSAAELGISEDASGLLELEPDAPTGTPLRDYLGLEDSIINIDLTPNRGDCFSVLGVARETAALNGVAFDSPSMKAVDPTSDETFPVRLEAPDACPRFVGRVIRNVATLAVMDD